MTAFRYRLRFGHPDGCPLAVLQDMARLDRATVISVAGDLKTVGNNVRGAVLLGASPPTVERWASFMIGTQIERLAEIANAPWDRRGTGEAAIVPGPRPTEGAA